MGFSPLCTYTRLSPNCTHPRNRPIDRLTPHVVVGQVTAERICGLSRFVYYDGVNGASCNYGIGKDGSIGGCVDEADRSWCTSSRENDHRAITFEIASDTKHPYGVTDAAYASMLALMTDICRRYGKTKLLWLGSKKATLAYTPAADEMVLTAHRWFENKACPGDYLYARYGEIAKEVTRRLSIPDPIENNKEEIDMTKDEMRALLVDVLSTELRPVIKEIVAEVYNELNPVYPDIKDVPEYWQPIAQKLLDTEAVNGGTSREVCDTDLNLRAETLKAAVIAVGYHNAAECGAAQHEGEEREGGEGV